MSGTRLILAALTTVALETAPAADYKWMANPADANWNTTSANWNDGEAWVDNAEAPNNATFGDSGQLNVNVDSRRHVNNLEVKSKNYVFHGAGALSVAGKLTNLTENHYQLPMDGGADGALHVTAAKGVAWQNAWLDNTQNLQTKTILSGSVYLMVLGDGSWGPVPAEPTENIVINDSPVIFAGASMTFNANRTMKLNSGAAVRIGSNSSFSYNGLIVAEPDAGSSYSTDTTLRVFNWPGLMTLNPGAGRTNAFGRLYVDQQRLKIASGVTCLTAQDMKTGEGAALYVKRADGATDFSGTSGILTVDGAEVYMPPTCSPYVEVSRYGQVVVTNGGKVVMPRGEWLNGLVGPGRLVVGKGGEFNVRVLRLSQSQSAVSEIHLNEGGAMSAYQLRMDQPNNAAAFTFDGGVFRSTVNEDGRNLFYPAATDNWTKVHFYVGAKGARFDTAGQNVWWNCPLESGAVQDGGVHVSGGKLMIFKAANAYNGPTVVASGGIQARADHAIPDGSTLRLGSDTAEGELQANTYESESPSRQTVQVIGRVEGRGTLRFVAQLHVTNAVAPAAGGTLLFVEKCDLRGDYEVACGDSGCGLLQLNGGGQDISNLKVKVMNVESLDEKAPRNRYRILSAPHGYSGKFDESELPRGWHLTYKANDVYLRGDGGLTVIVR